MGFRNDLRDSSIKVPIQNIDSFTAYLLDDLFQTVLLASVIVMLLTLGKLRLMGAEV